MIFPPVPASLAGGGGDGGAAAAAEVAYSATRERIYPQGEAREVVDGEILGLGLEKGDLEEALRAEDLRNEERSLREAIARASGELRSEKENGGKREREFQGFDRLPGFMLLR